MLWRTVVAVLALFSACASAANEKAPKLSDVHLAISDAQGASTTDASIKYPKAYASQVDVSKSSVINLSFGVSEPTAEQVFVKLTHKEHPYVKTFPTAGPNAGLFVFKLDLGVKGNPKLPKGPYSLEVLVAGNKVEPLIWKAADVQVNTATEFKPQIDVEHDPELQYTFPPPPNKPPALLATIFSAAVIAPFVFLLGAWAKIGVNIKAFSPTPAALVFHASIAAMFGLFTKFWLDTTMFETLYYGFPLALVMFFSGNWALSHLKYGL